MSRFIAFILSLIVFSVPSSLLAMSSTVKWDCTEFASGCSAEIPSEGTNGDMSPQTISVPPSVTACADGGLIGGIGSVEVFLKIAHTKREDLDVKLTHVPSGKTAILFTDVGSTGKDFEVTLKSSASVPIGVACVLPASPCTGEFQPEVPNVLDVFSGEDPVGEWRLEITDDSAGDSGQLLEWAVFTRLLDDDGDGIPSCFDRCPGNSNYIDSDGDGTPDCEDACSSDPMKTAPGACGCGTADTDNNANGIADCSVQDEIKNLIDKASGLVSLVKPGVKNKGLRKQLQSAADEIDSYMTASGASVMTLDAGVDPVALAGDATAAMREAGNATSKKQKKAAKKGLKKFKGALS